MHLPLLAFNNSDIDDALQVRVPVKFDIAVFL